MRLKYNNSCISLCRNTLFYWASLNCASRMGFVQIEVLWHPCVEQVYQRHFPAAVAHFMSMCLILIILTIFHTFSLLYLLGWSVVSDF